MLEALPAIFQFFLNFLSRIFNIYVTSSVLAGFFTLYILDRAFGIFDIIKHR